MGSTMVMGRKTFESLPGLPPGRRHIVLTRDRDWFAVGGEKANSVDTAVTMAGSEAISVIGGADIFALFLPLADRLELTEVLADVEGDVSMPDPRHSADWVEVSSETHEAESGRPAYRFVTLDRAP